MCGSGYDTEGSRSMEEKGFEVGQSWVSPPARHYLAYDLG